MERDKKKYSGQAESSILLRSKDWSDGLPLIMPVSVPQEDKEKETQQTQVPTFNLPSYSDNKKPDIPIISGQESEDKQSQQLLDNHGSHTIFDVSTNELTAESSTQFSNDGHSVNSPFNTAGDYTPPQAHWLFKKIIEDKPMWYGFSPLDSNTLEGAYQKSLVEPDSNFVVSTNGKRYDVYVNKRIRKAIYWEEKVSEVRRCIWFYKIEGLQKHLPYEESTSNHIENLYKNCMESNKWLQRHLLNNEQGMIYFEDPHTVIHYISGFQSWPNLPTTSTIEPTRARSLLRGFPDTLTVLSEEICHVDHVVFIVQGIGSYCDMHFRTVSECVDGFRDIADRLATSHFKDDIEAGNVGRIEFLPVAWHASLHTDNVGFDRALKSITLPCIGKLRHFINDTLLDILLYSSPLYCETIINTVVNSLNNSYKLFMEKNPDFRGGISVAGHSLGSLILFDILANVRISEDVTPEIKNIQEEIAELQSRMMKVLEKLPKVSSNMQGHNETLEVALKFLNLENYSNLFATGQFKLNDAVTNLNWVQESDLSEIGLPEEHHSKFLNYIKNAPRCYELQNVPAIANFENISEFIMFGGLSTLTAPSSSLCPLNPAKQILSLTSVPDLLFQPKCFFALGSPIGMFLAVRGFSTISKDFHFPTCSAFFNIFHPYDPVAYRIEPLIDPAFKSLPVVIPHHKGRKRMHYEIRENLAKMGTELKQRFMDTVKYTVDQFLSSNILPALEEIQNEENSDNDVKLEHCPIGSLNGGRRIDYVLQEKPLEALNEYIFALTSHATYWNSEDTVLMILKEIHSLRGVFIQENDSKQENEGGDSGFSHDPTNPSSSATDLNISSQVNDESKSTPNLDFKPSESLSGATTEYDHKFISNSASSSISTLCKTDEQQLCVQSETLHFQTANSENANFTLSQDSCGFRKNYDVNSSLSSGYFSDNSSKCMSVISEDTHDKVCNITSDSESFTATLVPSAISTVNLDITNINITESAEIMPTSTCQQSSTSHNYPTTSDVSSCTYSHDYKPNVSENSISSSTFSCILNKESEYIQSLFSSAPLTLQSSGQNKIPFHASIPHTSESLDRKFNIYAPENVGCNSVNSCTNTVTSVGTIHEASYTNYITAVDAVSSNASENLPPGNILYGNHKRVFFNEDAPSNVNSNMPISSGDANLLSSPVLSDKNTGYSSSNQTFPHAGAIQTIPDSQQNFYYPTTYSQSVSSLNYNPCIYSNTSNFNNPTVPYNYPNFNNQNYAHSIPSATSSEITSMPYVQNIAHPGQNCEYSTPNISDHAALTHANVAIPPAFPEAVKPNSMHSAPNTFNFPSYMSKAYSNSAPDVSSNSANINLRMTNFTPGIGKPQIPGPPPLSGFIKKSPLRK